MASNYGVLFSLMGMLLLPIALAAAPEEPSSFEELQALLKSKDPVRPFKRLRIGPYRLTEDTLIQVDELIFEGSIVTNGHRLVIDARRIVFPPFEVGVMAFANPASVFTPEGQPGPDQGQGVGRNGRVGATGLNNDTPGGTGPEGYSGMKNPQEIVIIAEEIVGVPYVRAIGQQGGQGGVGGRGGQGGRGGDGENGLARCPGRKEQGGDSGGGGRGAPGGRGGRGGDGGDPVPVRILYAKKPGQRPIDFSQVVSAPGEGGEGGVGGQGGVGGPPGTPGGGDRCTYLWEPKEAFPGIAGPQGAAGPTGEPGEKGGRGAPAKENLIRIEDVTEFAQEREKVIQARDQFRQSRDLYVLIADSLRVVTLAAGSREELLSAIENPDFKLDLEAAAKRDMLANVIHAWREKLILPMEQQLLRKDLSPATERRLRGALGVAKRLTELLNGMALTNPAAFATSAQELLVPARQAVGVDVRAALESCRLLDAVKARGDFLEKAFGVTDRFGFAVCQGNPNLLDPRNLFTEFPMPGDSQGFSTDPWIQRIVEVIRTRGKQEEWRVGRPPRLIQVEVLPPYGSMELPKYEPRLVEPFVPQSDQADALTELNQGLENLSFTISGSK